MRVVITKVKQKRSKYGDIFYYVFFKDRDKNSYKTCIYPKMRNYQNWIGKLKAGLMLDNVMITRFNKKLIDADSRPIIFKDLTLINPNLNQIKLF